jgi:hypothetical protein
MNANSDEEVTSFCAYQEESNIKQQVFTVQCLTTYRDVTTPQQFQQKHVIHSFKMPGYFLLFWHIFYWMMKVKSPPFFLFDLRLLK